ncbi:MAG: hypothetical protein WC239_11230, partial [Sphaerochaetaceae bacterium]
RSIVNAFKPKICFMLAICFFLASSLSATNIYVDGDKAQNGTGTIRNPYNRISYAINEAHKRCVSLPGKIRQIADH